MFGFVLYFRSHLRLMTNYQNTFITKRMFYTQNDVLIFSMYKNVIKYFIFCVTTDSLQSSHQARVLGTEKAIKYKRDEAEALVAYDK